MAIKSKVKVSVSKKTVSRKAPAKKPVAKKAPAKKPAAKKVMVKKTLAKKLVSKKIIAKKSPTKKPIAKVVAKKVAPKAKVAQKPMLKVVPKKAVAKVPVSVQKPFATPKADTRHTLDRAPSAQNKAPITTVGRQQHGGRNIFVVAPQISTRKNNFSVGEFVVYPTHGVGKIMGHEVERIGEHELKVFVIAFEKDKMTLRVPVGRAEAAGLRSISSNDQIGKALATLKGRAKIARGMWSRRAQEYEAKINSGNLVAIAEVVRDLHKNVDQSERSYSERMIYETAMHRLCGEVAASEKVDVKDAQDRLLKVLRKQAAMAA
jgi:CarD family transcriptional regulator